MDRRKIKINRLKLTPDEMKTAMERSSRNVKRMVRWVTPDRFKTPLEPTNE